MISEEVGSGIKRYHIGTCLVVQNLLKFRKRTQLSLMVKAIKQQSRQEYAQIRAQIEETTSDFDREKLQERLAKLAGGVAVIRVGAATETEMKEAKLRMEDALAATRAAVEEGIIAGGGSAYIHASKKVAKLWLRHLEGDEKTGAKIILKALEAPLYLHFRTMQVSKVLLLSTKYVNPTPGVGFNALTEEYVDMVRSWYP